MLKLSKCFLLLMLLNLINWSFPLLIVPWILPLLIRSHLPVLLLITLQFFYQTTFLSSPILLSSTISSSSNRADIHILLLLKGTIVAASYTCLCWMPSAAELSKTVYIKWYVCILSELIPCFHLFLCQSFYFLHYTLQCEIKIHIKACKYILSNPYPE